MSPKSSAELYGNVRETGLKVNSRISSQVKPNRPVLPPGGGPGADSSPGIRRHHHPHVDKKIKVVRLSELLSVVRLPPHAEACPMVSASSAPADLRGPN